jgi:hypothetical protein
LFTLKAYFLGKKGVNGEPSAKERKERRKPSNHPYYRFLPLAQVMTDLSFFLLPLNTISVKGSSLSDN